MRRIFRGIQRFVIDSSNPFIIKVNHSGDNFRGQKIDKPLQTVTAKNGWEIVYPMLALEKSMIATSHLIKLRGTCRDGQAVSSPMPTITAGGLHVGK